MKGYIDNIERATLENDLFRKVLYTGSHAQLVLMSIPASGDIGAEIHDDTDQFIRCEEGEGKAVLDGVEYDLNDGTALVVPAGIKHNIANVSSTESLRLYTLYAPPHHKDGVEHSSKKEAEEDDEHYDGVTSEDK